MAANGTPDLSTVLDQLGGSLDSVQAALEPLLARPLEETLAELPGPIERAKVLFWIAYTIHSCSWVYAKTRGADVETHGVLDELKRIQPYNGKINAASKQTASGASGGDKRTFKIDKDAASRFIRAGTHNKAGAPNASSSFYTSEATVDDPRKNENDGPGVHSRLSSLSRNAAGKGKKPEEADSNDSSSSSSEEGDLQVHNGGNEAVAAPTSASTVKGKKRKWNAEGIIEGEDDSAETGTLDDASKKATQDPLQGYDGSTNSASNGLTSKQKKRVEKKLKRRQQQQLADTPMNRSAAASLVSSPAPSASSTGDAGEGSSSGSKAKKRKNKKVAE